MKQGRLWTLFVAMGAVTALCVAGALAAREPTKTVRISVKANGNEVPGAQSEYAAISADGRLIAFETDAKLVGKDDADDHDVYVYDRRRKRSRLVSVRSNGSDGVDVEAAAADISPNGRYVCFGADGPYVGADGNDLPDVYRHDRRTGRTIRISVKSDESELSGIDDESTLCGVSDNGLVAWESMGAFTNDDTNDSPDLFVRNAKAGTTRRASLDYQDNQLEGGAEIGKDSHVAISGNGKFVAWQSFDVATADPDSAVGLNGMDSDVFVRNIANGTTTRASLRKDGEEPVPSGNNAVSRIASISADGRFVAFLTDAPFAANDANNSFDVYVKDREVGKVRPASVKANEDFIATPGNNWFEISPSGRYVAWDAFGNFGGPPDPSNARDVYRRDLKEKGTKIVSLKANGDHAGLDSQLPDVSSDGRWIPFQSMYKATAKPDDGMDWDVFLRGPVR